MKATDRGGGTKYCCQEPTYDEHVSAVAARRGEAWVTANTRMIRALWVNAFEAVAAADYVKRNGSLDDW